VDRWRGDNSAIRACFRDDLIKIKRVRFPNRATIKFDSFFGQGVGELDPAICGISVPLRDFSGKVIAAISINLISGTYSEEAVKEKFLLPLKRTAQEIRMQMS